MATQAQPEERSFVDSFGVEIIFDRYLVKNERAVVLIEHGLGDHAARYKHVAAALNNAGYSVYAPDQRGHGRTGVKQFNGDLTKLGHLGTGGFRAAVADMTEMTQLIRNEHPNSPIIFLGHSMGSLMGQVMLNEHADDYVAVVFTGTAYRQPGSMEAGDLNRNFKIAGGTGHEWLSRDARVGEAFKHDPYCFDAKPLKLYGLVDSLKLFGKPAKSMAEVPLLIMIGSDDSLGGEKSVLKLAEAYMRAGQDDVTVTIYPGARHEIFNETNKEEVIDDLIAWIDQRIR